MTTIVDPALSSDAAFHPTRQDTYDAQGHLTRQVMHVDTKTSITVQYGVDQNGKAVVASADASYTASPPGTQHDEAATSGCQFTLGFKTMHDMVPAVVGDCVDNAAFAANGDSQQHTTRGLLAWRKSDNWTAFTDGSSTWINGPGGIATRPNTERFPWEANPDHLPVVSSSTP